MSSDDVESYYGSFGQLESLTLAQPFVFAVHFANTNDEFRPPKCTMNSVSSLWHNIIMESLHSIDTMCFVDAYSKVSSQSMLTHMLIQLLSL